MEDLPIKLWGLDPLHWAHVKLFARDVIELKPYPGFKGAFAISNHPIVKAQITGILVKVEKKPKLTIYAVDDGTASIPCCHWVDQDKIPEDKNEQPKLGQLVTVLGKITVFRKERQIRITTIYIEKDLNAEVLFWLEVLKNKEIYNKSFETPEQLNPKAKVSKKAWSKDPLDNEIKNLEQTLKEDISKFVASKNLQSFTIDNLYDVNDIKEKAIFISNKYREQLGKKSTRELDKEVVTKTLGSILRLLEKDGVVYQENNFGGHYEVISKQDLCSQILVVMQAISNKEGESSFGFSFNKIMTNLKSIDRYVYIRRNRFEQAMTCLLESGDIYETKEYHYRRT